MKKNAQESRQWIWQAAGQQHFASLVELNAWLGARCRALWGELPNPESLGLTIVEALEYEQTQLMPMPGPLDGYLERLGRVSNTCLMSVQVSS